MKNKLYVGNLNFAVTQQDLLDFFMGAGTVLEATVVTDRSTGNSRGFGFVTMSSENEAIKAIEELNGKSLLGQEIAVKLAMEREARPQRESEGNRGYRSDHGRSGSGGHRGKDRRGGYRGR